ncbi:hypothetical protein TWF696_005678 [Orbilia brochopaga]|uniref:WSC domain-containing protein n=1 Tax=Orbilia brochopaga TaxID=3140254 RepID=A0AAV9UWT2_9PEZI
MRSIPLIASAAVALATGALAAPSSFIPKDISLNKRTLTNVAVFPTCPTKVKWKHYGCFPPDVAEDFLWYAPSGVCCDNLEADPIGKCTDWCRGAGFRHAGVYGENGKKWCRCGSGLLPRHKYGEENCNRPCAGKDGSKCGGVKAYSVYRDTTYRSWDPETAPDGYKVAPQAACWKCSQVNYVWWKSPDASGENLSTEKCHAACGVRGYPWAATYWRSICYCGGKPPAADEAALKTSPLTVADCNAPCAASSVLNVLNKVSAAETQYCGGWDGKGNYWPYYNMYYNKDIDSAYHCGKPGETSGKDMDPNADDDKSEGGKKGGRGPKKGNNDDDDDDEDDNKKPKKGDNDDEDDDNKSPKKAMKPAGKGTKGPGNDDDEDNKKGPKGPKKGNNDDDEDDKKKGPKGGPKGPGKKGNDDDDEDNKKGPKGPGKKGKNDDDDDDDNKKGPKGPGKKGNDDDDDDNKDGPKKNKGPGPKKGPGNDDDDDNKKGPKGPGKKGNDDDDEDNKNGPKKNMPPGKGGPKGPGKKGNDDDDEDNNGPKKNMPGKGPGPKKGPGNDDDDDNKKGPKGGPKGPGKKGNDDDDEDNDNKNGPKKNMPGKGPGPKKGPGNDDDDEDNERPPAKGKGNQPKGGSPKGKGQAPMGDDDEDDINNPTQTLCFKPKPVEGCLFPVSGKKGPVLSCQNDQKMFSSYPFKLFTAPGAPCPQNYKATPHDLWRACTNAALEQEKACKKAAGSDKKALNCCAAQSKAARDAIKDENIFKKHASTHCKKFGKSPTDDDPDQGYIRL